MPIDWTNLPDKPKAKPQASGGVDLSGLPDQPSGSNHPMLAALTRLLGGVGSAIASPADITGWGSVIPASIAGGSEAAAEWLEGSPMSASRIGTEAAIGAIPFAKMVKEGRVLANMGKAGVLGAVGEGAREKARGEDISPLGVGLSGGLNALTYGAFSKLMGRVKGGGGGVKPVNPTEYEVVPTSHTGEGTGFIQRTKVGNKTVATRVPVQPVPNIPGSADAARMEPNLGQLPSRMDPNSAHSVPIMGADFASGGAPSVVGGPAAKSAKREAGELLLKLQEAKSKEEAARLYQQALDAGYTVDDPRFSGGFTQAGEDAEAGLKVTKRQPLLPPEKEDAGGDGGSVPNGGGRGKPPESPLAALERRLGMHTVEEPPVAPTAPTAPTEPPSVPSEPNPPFSIFHAGKTSSGWNELNPGPPREGAPWGGAAIPNLEQYLLNTAEGRVAAGNRVNVEPMTSAPASPVSRIAQVLRPRRSIKTPEGFNAAVERNLAGIDQPPSPVENVVPGASGSPGEPIGEPGVTTEEQQAAWRNDPATFSKLEAARTSAPPSFKDWLRNRAGDISTPEPPKDVPNGAPPPPESALAKFFKTKQGATGANYRAAKDAAKAGEIPTADYARDSHLIQLGKEPEGPLAGGAPSEQVPPVAGGTIEPPVPSTIDPNAPDWVKQELERLDRLKALNSEVPKDPNERGAIAPGLMRLLTAGTGAAIGAPVGSYLDPDDPNASTKGALAGGALGYAGSKGVQELINWRNAGLLATPSAQLKKPLSDLGAYISKAGESALSGKFQSETVPLMREMFNPVNITNYGRAFRNPRLAEDVIGDTAKPYIEPAKGLMGLVARPFAGAQYATSQAMIRAGISPEEAKDILFLGQPKTEILQKWLNLQKTPGWGGQVVRAMRPFARISTNLFERGWQRIPGISMVTGDPETRMARTILGTGAMAAGAMTGHSDQEALDQGGYEVSPIVRGLRRALLASYGIPFMAGEALAGPAGMRDLAYMIPGSTQNIPMPGPKDDAASWGKKIGKRWLDQMMPDWLAPQDWEAKPQR